MQEDLDGFLALADEFQLQGLIKGPTEDSPKQSADNPEQKTKVKHKISLHKIQSNPATSAKEEYFDSSFEESQNKYLFLNDYQQYESKSSKALVSLESTDELDEQIEAMMTKSVGVQGWSCTMCEKTFNLKGNARSHIDSNHIQGASHPCNLCGKISRSRNALRKHLERQYGSNN